MDCLRRQPPAQILGVAHGHCNLKRVVIDVHGGLVKPKRRFNQVVQRRFVTPKLEINRFGRVENAHGAGMDVEIQIKVFQVSQQAYRRAPPWSPDEAQADGRPPCPQ